MKKIINSYSDLKTIEMKRSREKGAWDKKGILESS